MTRQTTQNTAKQNYPVSVAFYSTAPWSEVGILYIQPFWANMGQKSPV